MKSICVLLVVKRSDVVLKVLLIVKKLCGAFNYKIHFKKLLEENYRQFYRRDGCFTAAHL